MPPPRSRNRGRTTIIVVSYNHRTFLADCVHALDAAGLDPATTRLVIVDNASTDESVDAVRRDALVANGSATLGGLPARLIANERNTGFAGGNNIAIACAIADGDDFVYLLNPDTEAQPGFLDHAIDIANADPRIAAVQSVLLRHPETERINSYGNALHFLGLGYANGDGERVDGSPAVAMLRQPRDIPFASGAGVLLRVSALAAFGTFNEELFVYGEDVELCWRLRLAGQRIVFAPASRVFHKYAFSRGPAKYYWIERNRQLALLWCYHWRTLALVLPAWLVLEAGIFALALREGWCREKVRAYRYLLDPRRWPGFRATRRQVQRERTVSDAAIVALFTAEVRFAAVSPWPLTRIANPALVGYWKLIRRLIR